MAVVHCLNSTALTRMNRIYGEEMKEKLGAVLLGAIFGGYNIEIGNPVPDHAILLIDPTKRTYLSPPCAAEQHRQTGLISIRERELRALDLNPDSRCREMKGFNGLERSITGTVLEYFGLLPQRRSRWNSDGTWNW